MTHKPLSIPELRDLINSGDATDPIAFLEAIMNGRDPRELSGIYELIVDIDNFSDGNITKAEWNEVLDYANQRAKYKSVTIGESIGAAKTMAEYLHPKRKQVEVNGGIHGHGDSSNDPLTEEEIMLFKEVFNDEF